MAEVGINRIGKYEILAELGQGGFGRVYRAFDPTVGRPVAIKILTNEGDQDLLTRFRNEAAAAGNLRHKNIVTIYEFGDYNGLPFLAMELLEGEDLQQVIVKHKPLTLLQKVSIMLQIADGLECAHRNGVVHRDVKPANIRLLADGTVKIMDFGIARLMGENVARLTRQGDVIGTLLYMAPEQIMGADVDALCDIFAYGVIFYELLTGKHPFRAPDPRSVLYKISSQDPEPIRALAPECPEALDAVVRRAIHRDRELRYQNLKDVQWDTEPILIDLQRERANLLTIEAGHLYENDDLAHAQSVLSEILELDPANRVARELRQTIQKRLKKQTLRPRIEALAAKADEALSSRQFSVAVEDFETALRLDPENGAIRERLDHARTLLEQFRAASRLVAEARKKFSEKELVGAGETLSEALRVFPDHPEAHRLYVEIQREIARREREQRLEEVLRQAAACLSRNAFDDATAALALLDADEKNTPAVIGLLERIQNGRAEQERKLRAEWEERKRSAAISEVVAQGQKLVEANRQEDAVQLLERAAALYAGEAKIGDALRRMREALAARERAEAIERLCAEAQRRAAAGEFAQALKISDEGLRRYPDDSALAGIRWQVSAEWEAAKRSAAAGKIVAQAENLVAAKRPEEAVQLLERAVAEYAGEAKIPDALARAKAALAAQKRDEAIERLCAEARWQAAAGKFAEALERIDQGLRSYPNEAALAAIRWQVSAEWEAAKRSAAAGEVVAQAEKLVAAKRPEEAVQLLERAAAQYPGEAKIPDALAQARAALAAQKWDEAKSAAIGGLVARSRELVEAKRPQEAVQLLERGGTQYAGEARIRDALARAKEALAARERAEAIERLCAETRRHAAGGEFALALQSIDQGLQSYPNEAALAGVRRQVSAEWEAVKRSAAASEVVAEAEKLVAAKQPEEAVQLLERAAAQYAGETKIADALARAKQARAEAIERLCAETRRYAAGGEFAQAFERIDQGLRSYPDEAALAGIRRQVSAEWEAVKRSAAASEVVAEAEKLVAAKQPEEAVQLLERAAALYAGETKITDALARAKRARAEAIEGVCAKARSYADAGEFAQALDILDEELRKYPNEDALAGIRRQISAEWEAVKRSAAASEVVAQAEKLVAAKRPEEAVQLLERVAVQYAGETKIADALARAKRARAEAIEGVCANARSYAAAGEFAQALDILDEELRRYPDEAALAGIRRHISAEWEAVKRSAAASEVVAQAEKLVAAKRPEEAVQLLERAAVQYAGEAKITDALARAKRARAEAIEGVCVKARSYADAGEFAQALDILDEGLRKYPNEDALAAIRRQISAEWETAKRSAAASEVVAQAEELVAAKRPEAAVQLLERAAVQYASETKIADALARAKRARAEAIEGVCANARSYAAAGEFAHALDILDEELRRYPNEDALAAIRRQVSAEWEAAKRSAAASEVVAQAEKLVAAKRPEEAVQLLERAAVQYAGETKIADTLARARKALAAKERAEAVTRLCDDGRRHAAAGEFARALQLIGEGLRSYPDEPALAGVHQQLSAEWEASKRSAAITRLVARSRELVEAKRPQEAVHLLEREGTQYAGEARIVDALARAKEELAARERAEAIERRCTEARSRAAAGEFARALEIIDEGLRSYPDETALVEIRRRTSAAWEASKQAALAARERAEAIQRLDAEAGRHTAAGEFARALEIIDEGLRRYPNEAALAEIRRRSSEAWERAEAIERLCAEARRRVEAGELGRALHILDKGLRKYPNEASLLNLRRETSAQMAASPPKPGWFTPRKVMAGVAVAVVAVGVAVFAARSRGHVPAAAVPAPPTAAVRPEPAAVERSTPPPKPVETPSHPAESHTASGSSSSLGTLVVETGVDGAEVFINGRPSANRTTHGQLTVPLEAKEYTVRAEKTGYWSEPLVAHARIGKGERVYVRLPMKPVPPPQLSAEAVGERVPPEAAKPAPSTTAIPAGMDTQLPPVPISKPPEPAPVKTQPPPPRPDPKVLEAQDWSHIRDSRNAADFAGFLKKYPGGPYTAQAVSKVEEIEWAGINQNDPRALAAYVAKYPSGLHAAQARNMLAQLQKVEQQRGEAERQNADRAQIRAVLKSYADAYARKDANAIVAVWPRIPRDALSGLEKVFRSFPTAISMELTPVAEPEIAGDTARVVCVSVSKELRVKANLRFTLARVNGRWVIDSVQKL